MPVLPSRALEHIPNHAQQRLIDHSALESYSTVAYTGVNGGVVGSGLVVEVDDDTWVENDIFTFQEVSETDTQVVLYDASRDLTLTLNLETNDLIVTWDGNQLNWDITGLSQSLTPIIPDGWLL